MSYIRSVSCPNEIIINVYPLIEHLLNFSSAIISSLSPPSSRRLLMVQTQIANTTAETAAQEARIESEKITFRERSKVLKKEDEEVSARLK